MNFENLPTDSHKNNTEKGKMGESIAENFLIDKGYKIIKKNFKFGREGEIDLIATHKDAYVFIEVKARKNYDYGDPLYSITPKKQKLIRRAAEGFLYVNKIVDKECRFDVITIDMRGDIPKIEHLICAF